MTENTTRFAAVTGASSGIGREIAIALANAGYGTILLARDICRLQDTEHEIHMRNPGAQTVIVPADLSNTSVIEGVWATLAEYPLRILVNCAGFGYYGNAASQSSDSMAEMLRVDIEALALLSQKFVSGFAHIPGTQLINVSSAGGYIIVPGAVTYCAAKFFVSAFTEGLDRELRAAGLPMRAKVFAPAATETRFGPTASENAAYCYDEAFPVRHTAEEAAEFFMQLLESESPVGLVDRSTFEFHLCGGVFQCAQPACN